MRHRKSNRPRPGSDRANIEAEIRGKMRRIVDFALLWETCKRPACWRACACRHPDVACFDERAGGLVRYLGEMAAWERFYGPFDETRIADLVAERRALLKRVRAPR